MEGEGYARSNSSGIKFKVGGDDEEDQKLPTLPSIYNPQVTNLMSSHNLSSSLFLQSRVSSYICKWMVWWLVLITLPKILRKDWSISRELRFFTQKMVITLNWIKLREWHSNWHSPQPRALTKKRRQSEVLLPFRGSTADRLNELCSVGVGAGAHTKGIRESDEERDEEADTKSENKVQKYFGQAHPKFLV